MSSIVESRQDAIAAAQPAGDHAVLLIHRVRGHELELKFFAAELARAGLHVQLHLPYIETDAARARARVPSYRAWVNGALKRFDELTSRHERVSVAGLGIGANLALKLGALRSNVNALVLMSTPLFCDGWNAPRFLPLLADTPLRFCCRYRTTAPYGLKNMRLREWSARETRDTDLRTSTLPMTALREARRLADSVKRSLGQVIAPTLVMHAREDDVASLRNAEYVVLHAASADIALRIFEDSYHLISLDNDKEAVAESAVEFLRRQSAPTLRAARREPAQAPTPGREPTAAYPLDPGLSLS